MALNLQFAKIAAPRGPGRPTGTPNRINADVRDMILTALNSVGGAKYLARQAELNPGAFMTLVGKVLPSTMIGTADGSPIHLHLVAAQLISAQLTEQMRQPPTIVSTATEQPANLLDAPVPTE